MNIYIFVALLAMPIGLLVSFIWLARKTGLIKPVDKSRYVPSTTGEKVRNVIILGISIPLALWFFFFAALANAWGVMILILVVLGLVIALATTKKVKK